MIKITLYFICCLFLVNGFQIHNTKCNLRIPTSPLKCQLDAESIVQPELQNKARKISPWPCGDSLDKKILALSLPAILNFAIQPLVGATDTFWVGRMSDASALAGQGAANQVFSFVYFVLGFIPLVLAPRVAKVKSSGDSEAMQKLISEAFYIGSFIGIFGTIILGLFPRKVLSLVLPLDSPVLVHAIPYLAVRAATFLPALLSSISFAAFRGTMDFSTPLKISFIANIVNVLLDPLLIFNAGLGVTGAAAATCVSEIISFFFYLIVLNKRKMVNIWKLFQFHTWKALKPLILGGLTLEMRSLAINLSSLAVARATQSLDATGTGAAAHVIAAQLQQFSTIILFAVSTVASVILPSIDAKKRPKNNADNIVINEKEEKHKALVKSKETADRLLTWGVLLGVFLGIVQFLSLPLLKIFSPLPDVIEAAKLPAILGSFVNVIAGLVFIGEGMQIGDQAFIPLTISTGLAGVGMIVALRYFGKTLGGIWSSYIFFCVLRLIGALRHHFWSGPRASRKIAASSNSL